MEKKGQVAIKFFALYGWAILVVVIAVITLAYFKVIDDDDFIQDGCRLKIVEGMECVGYSASEDQIELILKNIYLEEISIDTIEIVQGLDVCRDESFVKKTISPGETTTFVIEGDGNDMESSCDWINSKERVKADIKIDFTSETLEQSASGKIIVRVK